MANTLKIKIILLIGSLSFLVFLEMYRNNFYKEVTLSPWRELNWDDFQGTIKPFTQYDAGISSKLYLEIDSMDNYYAYAAQNNQKSWVRGDARNSSELLRHEQYHFNITEVLARKMNRFIRDNPDPGVNKYSRKFGSLNFELRRMQQRYDFEADHSLNPGKQSLWEYRIDSMLMALASQPENLIDKFTGASLPIPESQFEQSYSMSDDFAIREFRLEKYDMLIELTCYQSREIDPVDYMTGMRSNYISDGNRELTISTSDSLNNGDLNAWVVPDSENHQVTLEAWAFQGVNGYNLTIHYEDYPEDSLSYATIAESLLNSFSITETSDYWVSLSHIAEETPLMEPAGDLSIGDEDYHCMVFQEDKVNGFYSTPIITKTDSLILPYQVTAVPDSLIMRAALVVQDQVFLSDFESSEHMFKISVSDLPKESIWGRIGYLLKADSTAGCYQFYNQSVPIYVGDL